MERVGDEDRSDVLVVGPVPIAEREDGRSRELDVGARGLYAFFTASCRMPSSSIAGSASESARPGSSSKTFFSVSLSG